MQEIKQFLQSGEEVLSGKEEQLKLSLLNFLSGGHTLIEDAPGVGKTTLVHFFSEIFSLKLSRIQFTNDLLPADIIGTAIFNRDKNNFTFHQGPIFGDIIMADELNRAPPKTQSALLQAMEEKYVTFDGSTYKLPDHFHVIATQNPHSQIGTYNLPESQLDRFSLKMHLGYPDEAKTIKMLKQKSISTQINVENKISTDWIENAKKEIENIYVDDSIYNYIYRLLDNSRKSASIPLSNRCGIDMVKLSKSYAFIERSDHVKPEYIQYLFPFCAGHRLVRPTESDIELEHEKANIILEQTQLRP
jgi:MoxR-like ATPase